MSKEIKIGLLAIIALAFLFWGYFFLKGRNLLTTARTYYGEFTSAEQLQVSAPVFINGLQIGMVDNIKLRPDDFGKVIISLSVDNDIDIPKDAIMQIMPNGIMGGKAINLKITKPCNGENCAQSGDFLRTESVNMLDVMIGEEKLSSYMTRISDGVGPIIDSLNTKLAQDKTQGVGKSLHEIEIILANLRTITAKMDKMMSSSPQQVNAILADVKKMTGALGNSQANISHILVNADSVTQQLKDANFKNTVGKTNRLLDESATTIADLKQTIGKLDKSLADLSTVVSKVNSKEGTLGKLVNDNTLYNDLDKTLKQTQLLLQDIRLNPKRYVNVSVIGRKQKDYDYPEDDPARIYFAPNDTLK